jgi:hypothetical protein
VATIPGGPAGLSARRDGPLTRATSAVGRRRRPPGRWGQ